MAAGSLHISISAETVTHFFGVPISNSIITSLFVTAFLIVVALAFKATYNPSAKPSGFHNLIEAIVEMFYDLIQGVTQSRKKTLQFFPFIVTFFLFITLNNWFGLLPGVGTIGFREGGEKASEETAIQFIPEANASEVIEESAPELETGTVIETQTETHTEETVAEEHGEEGKFVPLFRAGTADLNTTLALAIFTQAMAQFFGFSYVGFGYLKKFFNFSNPIMMFVGLLEFMGEFTKVVSFAFRLFGNIFAGEVLLAVMAYISTTVIPGPVNIATGAVLPMPFYALEIFVGVIQGLVFAMLSLVFFTMATIGHSEEH